MTPGTGDLPLGLSADVLAAATAEDDPGSLAAASRLRVRFGPEQSAAALNQAALRRRARTKFGDAAAQLFLTRDGLEQATRPDVADQHAARFVAAGVRRVVDLGCGIGSDSMAFLRAGLDVLAVDLDPTTADVARANVAWTAAAAGSSAEVVCADAAEVVAALEPGDAVFADPARRTSRGRVWRVADFTPDLGLLLGLVHSGRSVGIKLGPALPHGLVPPGVEAEWVSHQGSVVEAALWAGPAAVPGRWSALLWPDARLVAEPVDLDVTPPGDYLYEPDGAVIRAGAVGVLGARLGASLLDPQIAYLTAAAPAATPFATTYAVRETLPYDLKALRRWVREHGVGRLEIKKRGIDVDPAALRQELRPRGAASATLVLTRTPDRALVLVVERLR